jgi:hypothetical protein
MASERLGSREPTVEEECVNRVEEEGELVVQGVAVAGVRAQDTNNNITITTIQLQHYNLHLSSWITWACISPRNRPILLPFPSETFQPQTLRRGDRCRARGRA